MIALYSILTLIGLAMTVVGIVWLVQSFNGKEIMEFRLAEQKKEFEITQSGIYGVFIVGTKYLRKTGDFSAHMREVSTQTMVEVKECTLKFKVSTPKRRMVEFFQFEIPFQGKYRIEFENINQISVNSYLIKSGDRHQSITGEHLGVLIKKTLSPWKKLLSILFLCFGINVLVWGIILTVVPGMMK